MIPGIRRALPALVAPLALLCATRPARAWEAKGHTVINHLAAEAMPPETPAFFKSAADRLAYLGPEPDRWKRGSGPQLYAVNGPDHFMDMEPVSGKPLPPDRYRFVAMVYGSDIFTKQKLTPEEIGFLPYRIAEVEQTLQSEWRDWRAAKDGTTDKAQIEQDIVYTAGVLGHYVADGANPLHTTVHYNGWDTAYAPNPNGYTTAEDEKAKKPHGLHSRFEGDFVDADITEDGVRPFLAPLKPVASVFPETVDFLKASEAQVAPLYDLEKKDAFRASGTPDPDGLKFVEQRMAAGASMLRDLWAAAMSGVAPTRRNGTSAAQPAQPTGQTLRRPVHIPARRPAIPADAGAASTNDVGD